MIHTIRTVAVGDQESKIDSPIILYRGDREVEVEFTINGSKFTFTNGGNVIKSTNATHGQLVINTPTGENMFSEVTECHDGKVVFVITKEMIDELIEVGFYSFQIRLFDESQVSRVTIPPVLKGIDIRNPIAAEDETNVVDIGLVDYAVVVKDEFEDLSTFLPDGNYNKTEWESKDVISGAKLNKIEDALYNINSNMEATDLALLNRVENINKNIYGEIEKLGNELESEVEEFERDLNNNVERFKNDISFMNDQIINKVKNDRPFHVSIKDYDIPQTNDITHILKEINDTASALGANIFVPSDKLYIISEEVIFTKPIVLFSDRIPYRHNLSSNTFGIGTTNNGCLIFRGNGCAIECLNVIGLEGNTNDGVRFEGGRPIIRDLSVSMHGGNGLVVGWNSDDTPPVNININGFVIDNITSKDNAGYGCVIADTTGGNNANAGIFTTCDMMYNDGGGLLLKNAHANVLLGLHIESNSGYGIKCEHAGGNCFIRPYIESSGLEDFYLDSDSNGNIVLGTRAGSGGVTEDGKNYLIGVIKGTEPLPYISEFITNSVYTACDLAGRWRAYSPAGRNLNLELSNTSSDGYVNVCHSNPDVKVGLRINGGTIIKRIEEHGKTINFGTIYKHSTKDVITDILGVHPSCITLTPSRTLPSGLFWCAYLNEDGCVVLRMANITDSDVVVNTAFTITVIS